MSDPQTSANPFTYSKQSTLNGIVQKAMSALDKAGASTALKAWVKRQDRYWPKEITADHLSEKLTTTLLPLVRFSAHANAEWSAQIGHNHKQTRTCTKCGGAGRGGKSTMAKLAGSHEVSNTECSRCDGTGIEKYTVTNYESGDGSVYSAIDNEVMINIGNISGIKCGERAKDLSLENTVDNDANIIAPQFTKEIEIRDVAQKALEKQLKTLAEKQANSAGDSYKGLSLKSLTDVECDYTHILYPIWIGSYQHKGKTYQVQVDGITGNAWVQLPGAVIFKRTIKWTIISAIVLFALIGSCRMACSSGKTVEKPTATGASTTVLNGGADTNVKSNETRAKAPSSETASSAGIDKLPIVADPVAEKRSAEIAYLKIEFQRLTKTKEGINAVGSGLEGKVGTIAQESDAAVTFKDTARAANALTSIRDLRKDLSAWSKQTADFFKEADAYNLRLKGLNGATDAPAALDVSKRDGVDGACKKVNAILDQFEQKLNGVK